AQTSYAPRDKTLMPVRVLMRKFPRYSFLCGRRSRLVAAYPGATCGCGGSKRGWWGVGFSRAVSKKRIRLPPGEVAAGVVKIGIRDKDFVSPLVVACGNCMTAIGTPGMQFSPSRLSFPDEH